MLNVRFCKFYADMYIFYFNCSHPINLKPSVEIHEYIYEKTVIYKDYSFKKYMLDPLICLEELHSDKSFFYSLKRLTFRDLNKLRKYILKNTDKFYIKK